MHRRNATLVVIEFGASWPSWQDPGQAGNTAVVAQHYEGEPGSLLTQVESRTQRLLAMGWRINEIVLVSNGRGDVDALAARALLARALLRKLKQDGGASLTFSVTAELGARAVHALNALESALRGSALASGVELSVYVDTREPLRSRSGRVARSA